MLTSPTDSKTALSVVTDNNMKADRNADRLDGWIDWYNQQKDVVPR